MSSEEIPSPCLLRCRYKAIENFFRRIAFNLGNSPSQTDVKIISCIPVDVSELQQRILCLEHQLQEAGLNQNTYNTNLFTYPATVLGNGFVNNTLSDFNNIDDKIHYLNQLNNKQSMELSNKNEIEKKSKPQDVLNIDHMQKINNRLKVYKSMANTAKSNYRKDHDTKHSRFKDSYLNEMAAKQYKSSVIYESREDILSTFSFPVCREKSVSHQCTPTSTSSTYTCYYKNIDKNNFLYDTKQVYAMRNFNQYDYVPVREKTDKGKKNKELYNNMEKVCSPNKEKRKLKKYKECNNNLERTRPVSRKASQRNSCYIDCGNVYPKTNTLENYLSTLNPIDDPNEVNKTPQDATPELKTDVTEESLKQIKSILQNVLQEVKANSIDTRKETQTKLAEDKNVNDFKCMSNDKYSFGTVSAQHMTYPSYHPGNFYSLLPMQYLPPLMMQHPRAYYPHCSHNKFVPNKVEHLNTIGTNTEQINTCNKNENESEKLIKEIYKSLNVNFDDAEIAETSPELKNSANKLFTNDVQIYNSRSYDAEHKLVNKNHKKLSPKGILVNNSLNMIDKETGVDYEDENISVTESYGSDVTTKTYTTVSEKKKRNNKNFLSKFIKKLKRRRDKVAIPKKGIKFKEDVETIEGSYSESNAYSMTSADNMTDYRYIQSPKPNVIKFEKKPKNIYRYYRNPFLEQEYRGIISERQNVYDSPNRPVYWRNYETRPVLLQDASKVTRPKYVKDKVVYPQIDDLKKNTGLNWLEKYKASVQKCGQNWKSFVLES